MSFQKKKKKWSGLQKIQKKRGGDVKYIKKNTTQYTSLCAIMQK